MGGAIARVWRGVTGWLGDVRERRDTARALQGMSEHQLRDIGLGPEDIAVVAAGGLPARIVRARAEQSAMRYDPCPLCGRGGQGGLRSPCA